MKSKKLFTSFLVSVVTLMLCLVSFAGTTLAWFTDTVSNTGNKIQAGTLKIDLLQNKEEDFSSEDKYVSIKDNTAPVFDSGEDTELLWEPGQTQVAYLAVANKGNLALKYNIILDVVDRETNEDLTKAMAGAFTYAVINQENPASVGSDWPAVKAKAVAPNGYNANLLTAIQEVTPDAKSARITAAPTGKLQPEQTDYFVIAIHMNEDAGNAYQNGLIEFDVNVVATQLNSEEDGFESPDYDKDATFPSITKRIEGKASTGKIVVNEEGKISGEENPSTGEEERYIEVKSTSSTTETNVLGSASIPIDAVNNTIPDGDSTPKPSVIKKMQDLVKPAPTEDVNVKDEIVITLNVNTKAATTVSIDLDVSMIGEITRTVTPISGGDSTIEVKQTSIKELAAPVIVNIDLEAGLDNVTVTHTHEGEAPVNMEQVTEYDKLKDGKFFYNRMTGRLSLKTSRFSEFDIKYTRDDVAENIDKGISYSSLADAFKEAKAGDTIKVLKDTDAETNINKNVVIDVNGRKVSHINVTNGTSLSVIGGGTFYAGVVDGAIISINEGEYDDVIFSGAGTVLINDGSFEKIAMLLDSTVKFDIKGGVFHLEDDGELDAFKAMLGEDTYIYESGEKDWYSVSLCSYEPIDSKNHKLRYIEDGAVKFITEEHEFDEDGVCTKCKYTSHVGKVQIHTYNASDYVCITDEGMKNKSGEPVSTILNGDIVYDNGTKILKLMNDVSVGQIDFTCDEDGRGGIILDLNGHILTANSWTALDIYKNNSGKEGYYLTINDSNSEANHPGSIVYDRNAYTWVQADKIQSVEQSKIVTEYPIKGGIITNLNGNKYGDYSPGDPYDGGVISTVGNVTIVMNGGTLASTRSNGDIGGICMNRLCGGQCYLTMNNNAAVVGCSAAAGGIEIMDTKFVMNDNAHISYCTAGNGGNYPGGAIQVYGGANSTFTMNDDCSIDHCISHDGSGEYDGDSAAIHVAGGKVTLNSGTIEACKGRTLFWGSDGSLEINNVAFTDCVCTGALSCWQMNGPLTINGGASFTNCICGWKELFDQNGHPTYINGGDFSRVNDSYSDLFGDAGGLAIAGGRFTNARYDFVSSHIVSGHSIVDNGDGTFIVR